MVYEGSQARQIFFQQCADARNQALMLAGDYELPKLTVSLSAEELTKIMKSDDQGHASARKNQQQRQYYAKTVEFTQKDSDSQVQEIGGLQQQTQTVKANEPNNLNEQISIGHSSIQDEDLVANDHRLHLIRRICADIKFIFLYFFFGIWAILCQRSV